MSIGGHHPAEVDHFLHAERRRNMMVTVPASFVRAVQKELADTSEECCR